MGCKGDGGAAAVSEEHEQEQIIVSVLFRPRKPFAFTISELGIYLLPFRKLFCAEPHATSPEIKPFNNFDSLTVLVRTIYFKSNPKMAIFRCSRFEDKYHPAALEVLLSANVAWARRSALPSRLPSVRPSAERE